MLKYQIALRQRCKLYYCIIDFFALSKLAHPFNLLKAKTLKVIDITTPNHLKPQKC
jgi:hypothetical protein